MAAQLRKSREGGDRVRKAVQDLSADELARLRRAFAAAQTLDDNRGYRWHAGIPGFPQPVYSRNRDSLFLPWNRACVYEFELMLWDCEPEVTLPVWDWTEERAIPEAFAASTVDGADNPLYAAPIDPAALVQAGEKGERMTRREPDAAQVVALPSSEDVAGALAFGDFEGFARALENLSDAVHVWVGGDMGLVGLSAYDPLYWAHRAMVDRIWATWQERHAKAEFPDSMRKTALRPFPMIVSDVLDISNLGYAYSPAPEEPQTPPLASGAESDLPADEDKLGFRAYAAAFAEMIAAPATVPPLAVGIFASWGMGKSTLMKAIVREIHRGQGTTLPERRKGEDPSGSAFIHIVEFNAWDYSKEEAIWPELARETMERN